MVESLRLTVVKRLRERIHEMFCHVQVRNVRKRIEGIRDHSGAWLGASRGVAHAGGFPEDLIC